MIQKYKDIMLLNLNLGHQTLRIHNSGFTFLNDNYSNVLHNNIKRISFNSLYANIVIQLYNEGLLDSEKDSVEKIKYYLNNREKLKSDNYNEYINLRTFTNKYWGDLYYKSRSKAIYVTEYLSLYFRDLVKNNKNIIYVDVDQIYYFDYLNVSDLGIDHDIEKVNYFFIKDMKRYASSINNLIKVKNIQRYDGDLKSIFIEKIRSDKLNKLGV